MKPHIRIYLESFGYSTADFIPSELSGEKAVDIHHINSRGMGGTAELDRIENLMALTRGEHIEYGDKKIKMSFLIMKHWAFMERCGVKFDKKYMEDFFNKHVPIHSTKTTK